MRALLAIVALGLAIVASPASARTTRCGTLTFHFSATEIDHYPVSVTQGQVSCRTARNVLTRFLATGTRAGGWFCVLGHDEQPYSAQCSRTSGPAGHIVAGLPVRK